MLRLISIREDIEWKLSIFILLEHTDAESIEELRKSKEIVEALGLKLNKHNMKKRNPGGRK